jgi:ABC-2 type transport system ATP-binding protein
MPEMIVTPPAEDQLGQLTASCRLSEVTAPRISPLVNSYDEPTNGLDPEARIEVWQEIQKLADGGTTVFLTTQYLEEAEKLADRIAILHGGTIIVSGTLAELRKLLPPAKAEYVERQPTLEEIFLAIVGSDKAPENNRQEQR